MPVTTENNSAYDTHKKSGYHHGDLRRALITEATARVRVHGEKAIVLREIAAEIGVSATAAYRHFENRQQLVEEVAARGVTAMGEAAIRTPVGGADLDPALAAFVDLRNSCIGMLEFAAHERPWNRMMLDNLGTAEIVKEAASPVRQSLQQIVERGIDAGAFRPGSDVSMDQLFWAGLDGLLTLIIFQVYPGDDVQTVLGGTATRMLDLCMTDLLTDAGKDLCSQFRFPARIVSDIAEIERV